MEYPKNLCLLLFLALAATLSFVAALAPQTALAVPPPETGFGPAPIFRAELPGDYVVGSNNTRQFGVTTPQTDPFNVNIAGIPAGAAIVKAYANWTYETNVPFAGTPTEANITINGNAVAGVLSGSATPDLAWSRTGTDAYTADVTAIVAGAGGNGLYSVANAVDDPAGAGAAYGEGFSLLVVWSLAGAPNREVDVYSGLTTTASHGGVDATAVYGFGHPYYGGSAHFFINGLDGQLVFTDDSTINGAPLGASATIGGHGPVGNVWEGLVGQDANSNMYDHAEGDSSPYMTPGDTFLTVLTDGAGVTDTIYTDFLGHSFGAISLVPEPSTFTILGLGIVSLSVYRLRRHFV